MHRTIRDGGEGLDWIGDRKMAELEFADDDILIRRTPQDLQSLLTRIHEISRIILLSVCDDGETDVLYAVSIWLSVCDNDGKANVLYIVSILRSICDDGEADVFEIPGATQHREVEKAGYLTKLRRAQLPLHSQWKRRYCVLSKGRLYYYEREDSKSGEKSNGVINLEYFDQVAEAAPKDCKKATNVFVITSQDRSFFDPGRHLFSADTLPDMKDWVRKLQSALEQTRNNNRPTTTTTTPTATSAASPSIKKDSGKKPKEQPTILETNSLNNTKERKKKKESSHRSRKSSKIADVSDGNPESTELPAMTSPIGIQLPGMTSVPRGGVALPGLSPTRKEAPQEDAARETTISESNLRTDDGLPVAGPTLACVTKQRNKGPQGRRAPQNRRNNGDSALKKRASSLSALEHQELNDNSDAQWLNKSLDMLDEANPPRNGELAAGCGPGPALPYKAYNYSSDDITDDDEENSQSDSFPTSAAAMPPPPPPRSASYGLELRQNPQLGQTGQQQLMHRSLGEAQESGGDVRGSKHSLREGRVYGLVGEWHGCSSGEQWIGSHSSVGQNGELLGSASPVMDDLDNMLMNQSIQQTSMALDSASESGSEGSACRVGGKRAHQLQPNHHPSGHKHSRHCHKRADPDLTRFAMAVKHLQRHVVEIDRAVFSVTGDMTGTRQEVTTLKEAVLALQADTDTITSTLSHLTEEAISAQQKITFATQIPVAFLAPVKEAEKVRKITNIALKEAEQARQDQLKSKKEYESLLEDMRSTIKSLKESQVSYNFGQYKPLLPVLNKEPSTHPKGPESSGSKTSYSKVNIELKDPAANFRPGEEGFKTSPPKSSRANIESQASVSASSKVSTSSRTEVNAKIGEESLKSSSSKSSRSTGESFASSSSSPRVSGNSESGGSVPPAVTKSSSFSQVSNTPKLPAYQSLFARPSSLISGLTQRSSLTKSVSFAEDKSKEKNLQKGNEVVTQEETKKIKEEKHHSSKKEEKQEAKKEERLQSGKKEEKQHSTLERKEKKDHKPHKDDKLPSYDTNSKERKSKEKKEYGSVDRKERKHRHKRSNHRGSKDEEHMISNLSLEDIPMADDQSNELLDRVGVSDNKPAVTKISSFSSSTQTPSNFSLGKSSSSPIVSPSLLANKSRSSPLNKEHYKPELCNSTASTPESSFPPCPFPQPSASSRPTSPALRSSTLPTVVENHSSNTTSLKAMHRPGSTPGPLARQGSMTTVPEDRAVVGPPPSRPGIFAISRQNSSPNIPLQRQNSGPSIPLQRQYSLGMVPEGGRLPRQESLMSVPEDRPLVDQTLPLSPSQSMTNFPLSPCVSASTVSEAVRRAARASMELVTGPVLAGSSMQEASATGTLAVLTDPEEELKPTATSTLKKDHKPRKDIDGLAI
ncbi:uncharacterized protein [Palaemon carinicauda]|uniref:uncharacterized protein n=1 Tax=Palaemon carinicauda TaxID=392227 RepID=UPI0035B63869